MHSPLADVGATRDALERHGLYTKHRLGQNFLVSDGVVGRILGLAELSADDVVLEVGPGIGTLTLALLGTGARVVAVEADRTLAPVLAETCGPAAVSAVTCESAPLLAETCEPAAVLSETCDPVSPLDGGCGPASALDGACGPAPAGAEDERFSVFWGDALQAVPDAVLELASPTKLVSNLPYQVAATIILQAFQTLPTLARVVVMVQREVADRICALPGTKEYGGYTAKLALLGQVTGRFEVGHGCFFPPPRVESAVVRIDRIARTDCRASELAEVADVIDAAFAQRRKTIRNSMAARGYEKSALDAAFAEAGIAPTCRAETLAPADFVRLWHALKA